MLNGYVHCPKFFAQGKCERTIALNTHYIILFKIMRDRQQIVNLGK